MLKTLLMPEDTIEQLNNKLKCFVADIADLEDGIKMDMAQIKINREHMKGS